MELKQTRLVSFGKHQSLLPMAGWYSIRRYLPLQRRAGTSLIDGQECKTVWLLDFSGDGTILNKPATLSNLFFCTAVPRVVFFLSRRMKWHQSWPWTSPLCIIDVFLFLACLTGLVLKCVSAARNERASQKLLLSFVSIFSKLGNGEWRGAS